jgi:hypothetical protein
MTRIDADRGLLYGILALQNGLIDRGTLVDALEAWALDKAGPLGRILRDRGQLGPEEESLLDALVLRHLGRHGGDPERSLADLDPSGSVRQMLAWIADTEPTAGRLAEGARVRAEGTTLPLGGRGRTVGCSTASGPRFRIIRPHTRAGARARSISPSMTS